MRHFLNFMIARRPIFGANDSALDRLTGNRPMSESTLAYTYMDSPIGRLLLAGDAGRLHRIGFATEDWTRQPPPDWQLANTMFAEPVTQLQAYFAGELTAFNLELHFGGTAFQNSVWTTLCKIPFGDKTSYSALARRIDRPKACRAVGAANGANPLPIVVPCHRVIGANGSLTGFGGGIETKKYLLEHEQRVLRKTPRD